MCPHKRPSEERAENRPGFMLRWGQTVQFVLRLQLTVHLEERDVTVVDQKAE